MGAFPAAVAQELLEGAEVADGVAGKKADASGREPIVLGPREQRKEVQYIVGLEQHLGTVGTASHGHRNLDLPRLAAVVDEQLRDGRDLGQRESIRGCWWSGAWTGRDAFAAG